MNITKTQFERIAPHFPLQRGNVKIDNFTFISAILYMAENGVMQRIFAALQAEQIIAISVEILALDSTSCKVHPDAHGALKKRANSPLANPRVGGTPSFMWYPQMIRSSLRCSSPAENATTGLKGGSQ
jgi:hypothetical protein